MAAPDLTPKEREDVLLGLRTGATVAIVCLDAEVDERAYSAYLKKGERERKAGRSTQAAKFVEQIAELGKPSAMKDAAARRRLAMRRGSRTIELSRELTTF